MKTIRYPYSHPGLCKKLLLSFSSLFFIAFLHAQVYYVKPGASGTGASWATAGDLQTIINAAAAGSQVWVAAGTYYPNAYPSGSSGYASTRDYAFTLKTGVAVYGGFAGTETLQSQRNVTANVTILSGDIGTTGTYTDDCYHVLLAVGTTGTAVLDGFTVRYGYANGSIYISYGGQSIYESYGAGIFCYNAYPAIRNCTFSNNYAATGGGIYCLNSGTAPVFSSCTFTSNTAASSSDGGGAVYCYTNTAITFDTCTFSSNKATGQDGGLAFGNSSSTFTFIGCTIAGNTAAANGGAIYLNGGTITLTTSSFTSNVAAGSGGGLAMVNNSKLTASGTSFTSNTANSASSGGGAIYCNGNTVSPISNCTFTSNKAVEYGGGLYIINGGTAFSLSHNSFVSNTAVYGAGIANSATTPTVANCTFSNGSATYGGGVYNINSPAIFSVDSFLNNTATSTTGMGGGGMMNDGNSTATISHCWFHGNVTSGGNGAGQYNNPAVIDSSCVFEANIAKGAASNGGGVYQAGGQSKIYNCIFVNNACVADGGGYYNNATNTILENCTFYNNTAVAGAGIYDIGGGNPRYSANMVWGNSPDGLALGAGGTGGFTLSYNNLQAAYSGGGTSISNTYTAPVFYNSGSYTGGDGKWGTVDDGLHLAAGSAGRDGVLISAGVNMADDITGTARPDIAGELYADAGAYEGLGALTLPVQLLSFTATPTASNTVLLQWQVNAAAPAPAYEVQESANGTDFITLAILETVSTEPTYQYTDTRSNTGTLYYRLKWTEGTASSYSSVAVIRSTGAAGKLSLWPSPVSGPSAELIVERVSSASQMLVTVTDASGRIQLRTAVPLAAGYNRSVLDASHLGRGVYFLQAVDGSGSRQVLRFEKL